MSHRHGSKSYSPTLVTDSATAPAIAAAIAAHVAAMHTPIVTPPVPPVVVPPPSTGIPPIPPKQATDLLHHDFATDGMGPFRVLTYPNQHPYAPGNGQFMSQYCDYSAAQVALDAEGLVLTCKYNAGTGRWDAGFVGTFDLTPTLFVAFQYGLAEVCAKLDGAWTGDWRGTWYYAPWGAPELDWPERIGKRDTANVRPGPTQVVSDAPLTGWHVYGVRRTPTRITFYTDGVERGHIDQAITAPMALLADSKVGLAAPDPAASPLVLKVAWWKVTP